ncbi:MAG: hypothetical protein KJ574_05415 [Nanoarchaeota archaeon]|nr:hypothetical protein [Nanoarchaeota archaeon]
MRIEIDTKHDTREELAHLAKMLLALSGSSNSRVLVDGQNNNEAQGGLFNLFNDDKPASTPESGYGDTYSLFDSQTAAEQKPEEKKDIVDELQIIPYG